MKSNKGYLRGRKECMYTFLCTLFHIYLQKEKQRCFSFFVSPCDSEQLTVFSDFFDFRDVVQCFIDGKEE